MHELTLSLNTTEMTRLTIAANKQGMNVYKYLRILIKQVEG
jgi:predicted DNA binding CopG/RHH family protein